MKPRSLVPGDQVRVMDSRHVLQFVVREPRSCGRPAVCVFHCAELGTVTFSDHDVVRRCILESRPRR